MRIDTARSIARIRYPDLDFDTAWRLANETDAGYLETCAKEADVNAQDASEAADSADGAMRRAFIVEAAGEAERARTLRAAIDFIRLA